MKLFLTLLLLACAVNGLGLIPLAHAVGEDCDGALTPLTYRQVEKDLKAFHQKRAMAMRVIQQKGRPKPISYALYGAAEISTFRTLGWPVLKAAATQSGLSVAEFLQDALSILELKHQTIDHPKTLEPLRAELRIARLALDKLEAAPPNDPFNSKSQHAAMRSILELLRNLQHWIYGLDLLERRPNPTLNPVSPFDVQKAETLLDWLEEFNLENALKLDARYTRRPAPTPVPVPPVFEALNIEALPALISEALKETAETPFFTYNDMIKRKVLPGSNTVYMVQDYHKNEFDVQFTENLIAELIKVDKSNVLRLLRALVVNNAQKSGMKRLSNIGSNIISLRTIMRGHLRIFGCLDGSSIILKLIKEVRDGDFSDQVPSNLCAKDAL